MIKDFEHLAPKTLKEALAFLAKCSYNGIPTRYKETFNDAE